VLDEQKQPFEERNTSQNASWLQELNGRGIFVVPTIFVNGAPLQGYRPATLLEMLAA
jgi:hypothetical protein